MLASDSRQTGALAVVTSVEAGSSVQTVSLTSFTPLRVANTVDSHRPSEVAVALVS